MSSVESRLTALTEEIQRRQMEQVAPVDGLSQSLFNLEKELAALDEQGKLELLEAMNRPNEYGQSLGLTLCGINRWIEEATR